MVVEGARMLGAGKVVVGTAFLVAPGLAASFAGDDARGDGARGLTRMFGIRDAALGAGLVAAPNRAGDLRRWLVFSSACDAIDFATALGAPPSRARTTMLIAAAAATVGQLALAARAAS
jgi:hypothetical protein